MARLQKMLRGDILSVLSGYGAQGVTALAAATPMDEGLTRNSWSYQVGRTVNGYFLSWHNSHIEDGVSIAIILQYGHGTRTGGFVAGRDYINPAIQPIFEKIRTELWKGVTSA